MPEPPSELRFLPEARDDLAAVRQQSPEDAERILSKIRDWTEKIKWGRVPQTHLTYLTGAGEHNFYRERVGNSGYRVIYEISGEMMTVVAVRPKGQNTYDVDSFGDRVG